MRHLWNATSVSWVPATPSLLPLYPPRPHMPAVRERQGLLQPSHLTLPCRFSAEGAANSKGEPGSKPSVVSSPATQPRKGGADWLGLKDVDVDMGLDLDSSSTAPTRDARSSTSLHSMSALPPSGSQRAPSGPNSAPPDLHRGPLTQGSPVPQRGAPDNNDDDQREDWLSHALSRKRAQGLAREDREAASGDPNSGGYSLGRGAREGWGLGRVG